jgi:hypothetical protein
VSDETISSTNRAALLVRRCHCGLPDRGGIVTILFDTLREQSFSLGGFWVTAESRQIMIPITYDNGDRANVLQDIFLDKFAAGEFVR